MNAVGIDVSKGKSTIAVMRPFGEIVASPYDVVHTISELKKLADFLLKLNGETRVVIEYTGKYHEPVALSLYEAGLFVSIVNPILIKNFGNNTIRRAKTDKKDAVKLANYALSHWLDLPQFVPEDEARRTLKTYNRQYSHYIKTKVAMKNNLISLLDQTFPGVNTLFSSPPRKNGHEKWIDFVEEFWHCGCVASLTQNLFSERYAEWCAKLKYHFSYSKAEDIYFASAGHFNTLPMCDSTKCLILQAVKQLNVINETLASLKHEMNNIASSLPEYTTVMAMHGVGETLGPQLIAEIGDIRRFQRKQSLVSFAGVEPPENQSGMYEARSRSISKQGPSALRKTLFQVMSCILKNGNVDDSVFQFLDRKRAEGKPYRVYMIAAANKFLRVYYGRVKELFNKLEA